MICLWKVGGLPLLINFMAHRLRQPLAGPEMERLCCERSRSFGYCSYMVFRAPNAWTSLGETNFHFSCNAARLLDAGAGDTGFARAAGLQCRGAI